MRYRIQIERLVIGYFVVVSTYDEPYRDRAKDVQHFTIPWDDLKVDDLQHVLEQIYRQVSETTP